jgi:serine/threonine-protein kinase PpkA
VSRVLVVEDDPSILELIRLHLASAGYETITAGDGVAGLKLALSERPDLILSDVNMPGLDGFGLLAALRANEAMATVPLIILSSREDRESFRKGMNLGADDYLNKPVQRGELLMAVESRLRRSKDARRNADQDTSRPVSRPTGDFDPTSTMALKRRMEDSTVNTVAAATASSKEVRQGSVLFADVRSFTTIAEKLTAEESAELLNAFFARACEPIQNQQGWIVKYVGDGVVAMFETDEDRLPDHAERALRSAVMMVLAAHSFNGWLAERFPGRELPTFALGVGVHTGEVVVCKMGPEATAETDIIGDTVNIASRLEGKTKEFGWSVVTSDVTADAAAQRFVFGRRGWTAVRGRAAPVSIVEVLGLQPRSDAVDTGDIRGYAQIQQAVAANAATIALLRDGAEAPAAPAKAEPALVVDGYKVVRMIGEGGMSKVYLAVHEASGQEHVLKLINIVVTSADLLQRFVQEHALISQVQHPNVARIYGHGLTATHAYIAMEYFPGGDLRPQIKKGIPIERALSYLRQIALALNAIHAQGIVHRDLKPDNLMLRADGSLALADFGIAKKLSENMSRTRHGEIVGTPFYLSPEQVRGEPVDQRADLYALGVIFFEMLTGDKPFKAESPEELLYKHLHAEVPALPSALWRLQPILDQLLAKRREDRFSTATEVLVAIRDEFVRYKMAASASANASAGAARNQG